MGIISLLGRVAKVATGLGGRLVKGVINKGSQILGKVSPLIKKGFGFIKKIPGFLGLVKEKKDQVSDNIQDVVNMLPNSGIKDKIQNIVNRCDQFANRVIDKGREISDRAMPWVDAGYNISRKIRLPYMTMNQPAFYNDQFDA